MICRAKSQRRKADLAGLLLRALVPWLAAAALQAQTVDQLKFDNLAARAKQSTEVTLDASTLQLAARQMAGGPGDEGKAKPLLANLKAIVIRSYEFAREGEYTPADVESMRRLFRAPGWTRPVSISSKKDRESFEVFTRLEAGKAVATALLTTEPKELTLVYMDGAIDLGRLAELGSRLGLPGATKKGEK